jgi:hypothetical protein
MCGVGRFAAMGREASGNAESEFYRSKAKQAIEVAERCADPLMRVSWLELAERWMKLIPVELTPEDEENPALQEQVTLPATTSRT